jgi:phosphoribosylglycinamide formyltransferase-1
MMNIAVFASGNGSNFDAIAAACNAGKINAHAALLVCDNPQAYVIERAKKYGMPCFIFSPKNYACKQDYEAEILHAMRAQNIGLTCLAGYMRMVGHTLLEAYHDRMLNIHPALLPAFKGAHGIRDAWEYGVKIFGATVHFVDHTMDGGKIIAQRGFEYYGNDLDEVETKIHAIEHELYVEAINLVMQKFLIG